MIHGLNNTYLYSAKMIIAHWTNGKDTVELRGTGFFVDKEGELALITNRHVVEPGYSDRKFLGYTVSDFLVVGYQAVDENGIPCDLHIAKINNFLDFCFSANVHNDIACLKKVQLGNGSATVICPIPYSLLATKEQLEKLSVCDSIAYPGFPEWYDRKNETPIFRMGTIASDINRFLQESNPNEAVQWGIQQYKIGDPVLFNESDRFAPVIYNNMKGKIVGIEVFNPDEAAGYIQFDIELAKVINGMDAWMCDFELLGNSERGYSVIRFKVYKTRSTDEDDEGSSRAVVPFQVAYAVSIHKAQGLEFRSVKIVITDEVDELITHNIFYTAITRAQSKLRIYWTPEVENKVLTSIQPRNINKDVGLLRRYIR